MLQTGQLVYRPLLVARRRLSTCMAVAFWRKDDTDSQGPCLSANATENSLREPALSLCLGPGGARPHRLENAGEGCDRLPPAARGAVVVSVVEQDHVPVT